MGCLNISDCSIKFKRLKRNVMMIEYILIFFGIRTLGFCSFPLIIHYLVFFSLTMSLMGLLGLLVGISCIWSDWVSWKYGSVSISVFFSSSSSAFLYKRLVSTKVWSFGLILYFVFERVLGWFYPCISFERSIFHSMIVLKLITVLWLLV